MRAAQKRKKLLCEGYPHTPGKGLRPSAHPSETREQGKWTMWFRKTRLLGGLEYVRRNGSELMGALAANATGVASGDAVLVHLLPCQNDDGGWERFGSDMEGALSTISQTWVGLQ